MRKKRIVSMLLTLSILTQCLPLTAHADEMDLSSEALMVSEEFAEKYPNGMIDIATQNTLVNEDAGEVSIYVVRRGGTQGQVDVSLKAIEVTAKCGEDFVLLTDGLFGQKSVDKEIDSPTLLESSLADYGDDPITVATQEPSEEAGQDYETAEPADGEPSADHTQAAGLTQPLEETVEPEAAQEPQETEAPREMETPEIPQVTEAPEVPRVTETPEVPQVTETPEVPQVTETPEVPQVTETPEVP